MKMEMENVVVRSSIPIFFLVAALAFAAGYLFSSRSSLSTEFVEIASHASLRPLRERVALYEILQSQEPEKIDEALELLIYGDLIAIRVLDASDSSNTKLLCEYLVRLKGAKKPEAAFGKELNQLLKRCL